MPGETEEPEAGEGEEWSFSDFLGAGRKRETIQELAGKVLGFEGTESLQRSLGASGLEPEDVSELRHTLGGRRRKWESDEAFEARRRAADQLLTVRGKMAWKPGGRDEEDVQARKKSGIGRWTRSRQELEDLQRPKEEGEE